MPRRPIARLVLRPNERVRETRRSHCVSWPFVPPFSIVPSYSNDQPYWPYVWLVENVICWRKNPPNGPHMYETSTGEGVPSLYPAPSI